MPRPRMPVRGWLAGSVGSSVLGVSLTVRCPLFAEKEKVMESENVKTSVKTESRRGASSPALDA